MTPTSSPLPAKTSVAQTQPPTDTPTSTAIPAPQIDDVPIKVECGNSISGPFSCETLTDKDHTLAIAQQGDLTYTITPFDRTMLELNKDEKPLYLALVLSGEVEHFNPLRTELSAKIGDTEFQKRDEAEIEGGTHFAEDGLGFYFIQNEQTSYEIIFFPINEIFEDEGKEYFDKISLRTLGGDYKIAEIVMFHGNPVDYLWDAFNMKIIVPNNILPKIPVGYDRNFYPIVVSCPNDDRMPPENLNCNNMINGLPDTIYPIKDISGYFVNFLVLVNYYKEDGHWMGDTPEQQASHGAWVYGSYEYAGARGADGTPTKDLHLIMRYSPTKEGSIGPTNYKLSLLYDEFSQAQGSYIVIDEISVTIEYDPEDPSWIKLRNDDDDSLFDFIRLDHFLDNENLDGFKLQMEYLPLEDIDFWVGQYIPRTLEKEVTATSVVLV